MQVIPLHRRSSIFLLPLTLLVLSCNAETPEPLKEIMEEKRIHPDFSISIDELEELLSGEREEIRGAILSRPEYFLELIGLTLEAPELLWSLVDKEHALAKDFVPKSLVALSDYRLKLNREGHRLNAICLPDLLAMNEAARADGVRLLISSAYRSYDYQKGLYERYVEKHGREEADRFSARPGTSQHQLGTAVDFGSITEAIADRPQGKWLAKHAWEYGFSLSYPEGEEELTGYMWEPWHFRYMSRPITRLEHEFFSGIQQYMTEFLHEHRGFFEEARN